MRETCPKEERLLLSSAVNELADKVLTREEIAKADSLTELLVVGSKRKREDAIFELQQMCWPPPKRPLYYLNHELKYLPSRTRFIVFNTSAFVELLCKAILYDKIERKMPIKQSLGTVIHRLKDQKIISQSLFDVLCVYNDEFFAPAKHQWSVINRRHLFTTKEAIYCIFITFSLAKTLRGLNEYADKAAKDEVDFDFIY